MMKITRRNKLVLIALVMLWFALGVWAFTIAGTDPESTHERDTAYEKIRLFNEVLYSLNQNYVQDLSIEELIDAAIDGMLEEVDPHTVYFQTDEFNDFQSNSRGEFEGIGLSVDKKDDFITVVAPIEGTPAYRQGIHAGDRLVEVDGESIIGISTDDAINLMRGPKGSSVYLVIDRPGYDDPIEFHIVRDVIKIKSVPYAFMLNDEIGYIRIRQYNANVSEELQEALDMLENQGMKGLLIDLRFNPGGLLDEAVDTVNEFIGKGKRVVYTRGRAAGTSNEFFTQIPRKRSGYTVVVLINEGTASAAEIFAGTMQDYDQGLVVGEQSFGKGSVQQLFPLSEGGIKITTSKYYINSGRCIHKDLQDKELKGKKVSEEEVKAAEEKTEEVYYTQHGRIVHGGGGITPDIVIEQKPLTDLESRIKQANLFFRFAVDFLIDNGNGVTPDFTVSDAMYSQFVRTIDADEINYLADELSESESWIRNSLASEIIAQKLGEVEGYRASLKEDIQLQKAVELFNKYPSLDAMFSAKQ